MNLSPSSLPLSLCVHVCVCMCIHKELTISGVHRAFGYAIYLSLALVIGEKCDSCNNSTACSISEEPCLLEAHGL